MVAGRSRPADADRPDRRLQSARLRPGPAQRRQPDRSSPRTTASSGPGATTTAGKHFGGVSGAKPLEVRFRRARLRPDSCDCRFPARAPIFFHLDEVEVYGPDDPAKNLALGAAGRSEQHQPVVHGQAAQAESGRRRRPSYPTAEIIAARPAPGGRPAAAGRRHAVAASANSTRSRPAGRALRADGAGRPTTRSLYLQARWVVRRLALGQSAAELPTSCCSSSGSRRRPIPTSA